MIRKIAKSVTLLAAAADVADAIRFKIKLRKQKNNISEREVYSRLGRTLVLFAIAFIAYATDEVISLFKK